MVKSKIKKIVGHISSEIANRYNLYEYEGKEIVQSLDLYSHIEKHINEFKTVDNYNCAVSNIDLIIREPDVVCYEKIRNSLLYFKKLSESVCVVVKLTLKKGKDNYVATIYPVSYRKIEKMIEKSYLKQ